MSWVEDTITQPLKEAGSDIAETALAGVGPLSSFSGSIGGKLGLPDLSAIGKGLTGEAAAEAAAEAARIQTASSERALKQVRSDLAPFRGAGQQAIPQMLELLDPAKQAEFVTGNPLLSTLADDVQARLFANRAARGKLGSGGTALALQNALVPLGMQQLQQQQQNLFNVSSLGANAAAQTGTQTAGLLTGAANAQASGVVGAANARQQGLQNLIGIGTIAAGM